MPKDTSNNSMEIVPVRVRSKGMEALIRYREPIQLASDRNLWDIQPKERQKHYSMFLFWRDLGAERTMHFVSKRYKMNNKNCYILSTRYRWKERLDAWIMNMERVRQKTVEKEVREMTERHIGYMKMTEYSLMNFVENFMNRVQTNEVNYDGLSDAERLKLVIDIAGKLPKLIETERLSEGESTQISENIIEKKIVVKLPKELEDDYSGD